MNVGESGVHLSGGLSMDVLELLPFGVIFIDLNRKIVSINQHAAVMLRKKAEEVVNLHWSEALPEELSKEIDDDSKVTFRLNYGGKVYIVQKAQYPFDKQVEGYVYIFHSLSFLEEAAKELDLFRDLNLDLKAIFDSSYDDLHVTDGKGITLRVSPACERMLGYKENELVGKSVYQLEREGVFNPSATRKVLEVNEKVSMVQTTKTGRRLMVVATPLKDEHGRIIRVVNASRDITEESQLQMELERLKQLAEGYRKEILNLRTKNELENEIVFRSAKMEKAVVLAQKMSEVDSSVLLSGGFGVGKDLVASLIHKWGVRSGMPFITVNCGSVPETMLETELFGLEGESSGLREGKFGAFEMAHDGTLFLDEVEAMPMSLQAKLVQVIHDRKMCRVGGSNPVSIKARIIASTRLDLDEEVRLGNFRKDLYYLLNIVIIPIPPLQDRREDIIPLIVHFTGRLNHKYGADKKISPPLLKKLQQYSWPGNVRELQSVVERLFVTAEDNWIDAEHMQKQFPLGVSKQKIVQVNEIVPFKKAIALLEIELLEMTRKQYGSSTKIAEVLGVNQSTISRKINKNRMHRSMN
jgi:PAS domain S-box-containing protein